MGPDHRPAKSPKLFCQRIDIFNLPGVGCVGGFEKIGSRVGLLRVDVDQYGFLAKAKARHFQVSGTAGSLPEEHPPYDVWCTADDDYILLRAGAGGYMQTHYELTSLEID